MTKLGISSSQPKPKDTGPPPLNIRIDWKAYFVRFCQEHGDPVQYSLDKLLFPDGWMYGGVDYSGPEWKPPNKGQEMFLKRTYWEIRLKLVKNNLFPLEVRLHRLEETQAIRSVPLQQQILISQYSEEKGRPTLSVERSDLDFEAYRERIDWLRKDMAICQQELAALTERGSEDTHV